MAFITLPPPVPRTQWHGCVANNDGEWCQGEVTLAKPLRLCEEHYESSGLQQYHEWRFLKRREMSRLVVEMELEEWTGMKLHPLERPETVRAARARSEGRTPPEPKNAIVYFVQCGAHVKIGTTTDLKQRLSSFTLPEKPVVLLTVPGYHKKEAEFHRRFADLRTNGEWFRHEGELRDFIEAERAKQAA